MRLLLICCFISLAATGCRSAYYGTLEKFGIEKRDVLVERVEDAGQAQGQAKEEFADALEQFRSVVQVDGGDLEETYDRLKDELESSEHQAGRVSERVDAVETVAQDLFEEWEQELELYNSAQLRRNSEQQLNETRQRYRRLMRAMRAAEAGMAPVLDVFRDQVLYLKHNLNARAVAALKAELGRIEQDVDRLIADMDRSINEAQSFIASLDQ